MKTFISFLTVALTSIFIISCSITEEITFHSNGGLSYSYLIDGSYLMKMMPDSANKKPVIKDSLISFADLLEKQKDSISRLTPEEQKIITALKPLNLRMKEDGYKKEYFVQATGDFSSSSELNSALAALNTISSKSNPSEKTDFFGYTRFEWDGKKLLKSSRVSEAIKTDSSAQNLTAMFNGGKYKVKYTFPKKILKVNNPKATISKDGKTLSVEYDASEYLNSPEKTNLEIELEK